MSGSPHENGRAREAELQPHSVKLLVSYQVGEREERWELGAFRALSEAIAAAKAMVDSFLLRHHSAHLRGRQLYADYVKYGPEIYVDAAMEEPVFHGWEYARKRVRQICGTW